MKKSLLKIVSLSAGNLLSPLLKPNPNYINKSIPSIPPIYLQKARFLTTINNAPNKTSDKKQSDSGPDFTHNKSGSTQVEDVSKEVFICDTPIPNPNEQESGNDDAVVETKDPLAGIEDISNKELKTRIEKYFNDADEEVLPDIFEAILKRKLIGKHEDTDDELLHELQMRPIDNVKDEDFESDFEEAHETDEEIDNLYDAMDIVKRRMAKDKFFNVDDKKWDDFIEEGIENGVFADTKECEDILEDMLSWDKLLPDDMKKKVDKKVNEIAVMIESGEIEPEKGYELFKEYEDEMVAEYVKQMDADGPPQFDETVPDYKTDNDDPPGEGPILRWQSRVVFCPGGEAWHPKNRKVKMGVTVKELGLSKNEFRRLKELVGKRYHPGKDELMITSERFADREENRKDCLRTLYSLLEEARKADQLVQDARVSYVKERLRANPKFMERLRAKTSRTRKLSSLPA